MDEIARADAHLRRRQLRQARRAWAACSGPATTTPPEGTPIMHVDALRARQGPLHHHRSTWPTRREGHAHVPAAADHRPHPVAVQRRRADAAHRQQPVARRRPAGDPSARRRGARHQRRRLGRHPAAAPARPCCAPSVTERMQPGVVYTTFHFPESGANVITTDNSDWATNCPEYKVTAVQVMPGDAAVGLAAELRRFNRAAARAAGPGAAADAVGQ